MLLYLQQSSRQAKCQSIDAQRTTVQLKDAGEGTPAGYSKQATLYHIVQLTQLALIESRCHRRTGDTGMLQGVVKSRD